jgi:hypothetical protein
MHGNRWHAIHAAIVAAALTACTSVEEGLIERGYSPAYAEGYDHGCASGKATSGGLLAEAQKDEARYAAGEGDYAQGWDAGYQKCLADMRAMVNDARTRNPSRDK